MAHKDKDIEVLKGKTNPHILLIAPHAPIIGKIPKNDRNTQLIPKSNRRIIERRNLNNGRQQSIQRI